MEKPPSFYPNPDLKLMDQVREVLRYYNYAYRTEQAYCHWILRYIRFHGGKTHPSKLDAAEMERFLSHLVSHENVSAATQKLALNALVFLYHKVLHIQIQESLSPLRSKQSKQLPTVLTIEEVQHVLGQMSGSHLLMAKLMYGAGLRLMETIRLRIQDVDFGQSQIYVREAKGGDTRITFLPAGIKQNLLHQIDEVRRIHGRDQEGGYGSVYLPQAISRKYPQADKEFRWQYLFPSRNLSIDPRSGVVRRHHVMESGLQKAIKVAAKKARIEKKVTSHTLRHSFATHLLEGGVNIRTVQKLMGHKDVKTTEIYTHVMQKGLDHLQSPLDQLNLNEH